MVKTVKGGMDGGVVETAEVERKVDQVEVLETEPLQWWYVVWWFKMVTQVVVELSK